MLIKACTSHTAECARCAAACYCWSQYIRWLQQ